jgi:hypothetical protein
MRLFFAKGSAGDAGRPAYDVRRSARRSDRALTLLGTVVVALTMAATAQAADMSAFVVAEGVAGKYFRPNCATVTLSWGERAPQACELVFPQASWRWRWDRICREMVHGFGHLAGLPDVASPRSIMHHPPLFEPRRCKTVTHQYLVTTHWYLQ